MTTQSKINISSGSPLNDIDTHRVLIVDDEPSICFAYSKLLKREAFSFDICDNIESAHCLLRNNQYFAVISDVHFAGLGNEDGLHFLTLVRKEQPESKVILVTGDGSKELEKTAKELGAYHYFEKPVVPSLILTLLRSLHAIADELEELNCFKDSFLTKTPLILE